MDGTLAFGLWLAAAGVEPAPGAPTPVPIDAPGRPYAGPEAAPTAEDVEGVPIAQPEPPAPEPAPQPPSPPPPPADADAKEPGPDDDAGSRREPAVEPRVLSSLVGFPEDEVATVRNERGTVSFSPGLQVRNQVGWVSEFTIDRLGETYDEPAFSTGRIRWRPVLGFGREQNVRLVAMVDLANGRWAPEGSDDPVIQGILDPPDDVAAVGQPPVRGSLRIVDPRELFVEWRSRVGVLRVGQMSFTWGQGILANDGNNVDRFGDMRFGDDGPGDLYERIAFFTRPFSSVSDAARAVVVGIGADLVFRDERASLVDGDLAGQALIVLRYQPESTPGNWIGAYAVYRRQQNHDDDDPYPDDVDLEVGVVDVAGQGTLPVRRRLQLIGAFEGVLIGGRTNFAYNDEHDEHRVLQGGMAVRGYIGDHRRWLVGFDAGYASGDPNPDDGRIGNFTFDRGHQVGLVLFPQIVGWRTARSEILATDGSITGEPLNGTQLVPTRGALTNAVYFHPKARWAFRERLELWGGPLFAFAPDPIVDPVATRLGGGTPKNSLLGDGDQRVYGSEIDVGLRARVDLRGFWTMVGLQYGVGFLADGLADAMGRTDDPAHAVWFRLQLRY